MATGDDLVKTMRAIQKVFHKSLKAADADANARDRICILSTAPCTALIGKEENKRDLF